MQFFIVLFLAPEANQTIALDVPALVFLMVMLRVAAVSGQSEFDVEPLEPSIVTWLALLRIKDAVAELTVIVGDTLAAGLMVSGTVVVSVGIVTAPGSVMFDVIENVIGPLRQVLVLEYIVLSALVMVVNVCPVPTG